MDKDTQNRHDKSNKKSRKEQFKLPKHLEHINKMAAGIDVGSKSHFVAVPEGCDEKSVREFSSFTTDLCKLADWLEECEIESVVMESTGVYWIPLFELLEDRGFDVKVTDARHLKNVGGRKTDVIDCQWLQQLHTYGLLNGAFRPDEQICALRVYLRQRSMLVQQGGSHIQHMQKALSQMNLQLHHVISDITGETGMRIIRAVVAGEHNPQILASYRDRRCQNSVEIIEQALTGHYRAEHIFTLKQALELYDAYQEKMEACDAEIEKQLLQFDHCKEIAPEELTQRPVTRRARDKNAPLFNLKAHLIGITGVDLTAIPGIDSYSALKLISEIGLDMSRWKNSKHFASWLGLCPGNKVSGGRRLSGKTKRSSNYAAAALRIAASTLHRSDSALGAFLRRMKTKLGAPKAITATAHKLATIIFNMLQNRVEYVETGQDYYEKQYRERIVRSLSQRAEALGFSLVENPEKSKVKSDDLDKKHTSQTLAMTEVI